MDGLVSTKARVRVDGVRVGSRRDFVIKGDRLRWKTRLWKADWDAGSGARRYSVLYAPMMGIIAQVAGTGPSLNQL